MTSSSTVLVFGRTGQLARCLQALKRPSWHFFGRPEFDLISPESITSALNKTKPHVVVNVGAYTAVDKAESEADEAYAVNEEGPRTLAKICAIYNIPLVHVSTDFVFDGSASKPYLPDATVAPIAVYGASKAAGEVAIRELLDRHVIVRTSWVYSEFGGNFLKSMLRLGMEREELSIVDDQTGSPTYARDLAEGMALIVDHILGDGDDTIWGTYHLSGGGHATWYEFANTIFLQAARLGYKSPRVNPIPTSAYPTPADRPSYSVLDTSLTKRTFGVELPHWQDGVDRCLKALFADQNSPERKGSDQ